jgi:hypothetical protein
MSDKNFKIRPTTWPKEYTFEEFKMLNPNINENILINYYTKYLNEYAEDRSRHINHFNDVKDNLSKEILTLQESTGKFGENADGDGNVGATGGGREFKNPLEGNKHSLQFDHSDDYLYYNDPTGNNGQLGIIPGEGTIKPQKEKQKNQKSLNKYTFCLVKLMFPYQNISFASILLAQPPSKQQKTLISKSGCVSW